MIKIARDLFGLGQQQFVSFIVEKQHFLFPDLIHFCIDNCTYLIYIFIIAKMFGTDENYDVIVNPDKGDFEIWRNREVVADEDVAWILRVSPSFVRLP